MRRLYYVPMVHTPFEAELTPAERAAFSPDFTRNIRQCWKGVGKQLDQALARHNVLPRDLLIFCDAVPHPISDTMRNRLLALAGPHMPIATFIRSLWRKGAQICGTEDQFLIELYVLCQALYELSGKGRQGIIDAVRYRDEFIARHISRTLKEGQSAVLFIGSAHHTDRMIARIAPDIRIHRITSFDALTSELRKRYKKS